VRVERLRSPRNESESQESVENSPMNTISRRNLRDAETLFVEAERFEEKREFSKAFRCLSKSAALGHSSSQLNLGNFYASGTGVRKNLAKAAHWYKAAYRRGNITAARNLAIDRVAAGNIRSAINWFNKGVEKGDGGSFVALAKIYAGRRGGIGKAIKLLKRVGKLSSTNASDLDREEAQNLLSQLQKA
jgi:TPR repeat protein